MPGIEDERLEEAKSRIPPGKQPDSAIANRSLFSTECIILA
jgi:hypothetical protein